MASSRPFPALIEQLRRRSLTWLPQIGVGHYPVRQEDQPYDDAYYAKYVLMARTPMGRQINKVRQALVDRHWKGPVIDVGIGCGSFLMARNDTYGFDVNPVACDWLRDVGLWLDPYQGCDAVTLWDVLEHIDDFPRLLEQVWRYVFVSIPIFRDADHVLASRHFRPDEHFWYFTINGLERVMLDLGWACRERNQAETELGRDGIASFVFERI
jgi:Methyltransferase domain